jgi:replication factor A1
MAHQLSPGICGRLNDAEPGDDSLFNIGHTLQILSIKKVTPTNPSSMAIDRWRLIISDGVQFIQAMLATQLNHLVTDETISKYAIILVERFTCNFVQDKK